MGGNFSNLENKPAERPGTIGNPDRSMTGRYISKRVGAFGHSHTASPASRPPQTTGAQQIAQAVTIQQVQQPAPSQPAVQQQKAQQPAAPAPQQAPQQVPQQQPQQPAAAPSAQRGLPPQVQQPVIDSLLAVLAQKQIDPGDIRDWEELRGLDPSLGTPLPIGIQDALSQLEDNLDLMISAGERLVDPNLVLLAVDRSFVLLVVVREFLAQNLDTTPVFFEMASVGAETIYKVLWWARDLMKELAGLGRLGMAAMSPIAIRLVPLWTKVKEISVTVEGVLGIAAPAKQQQVVQQQVQQAVQPTQYQQPKQVTQVQRQQPQESMEEIMQKLDMALGAQAPAMSTGLNVSGTHKALPPLKPFPIGQ